MKVRTSFVANSSSSSFVLIGIEYTNYEDIEDKAEEFELDIPEANKKIVGVNLCGVSDEDWEVGSMCLSEVQRATDKVKEAFGEDCKPKIFFGMEMC